MLDCILQKAKRKHPKVPGLTEEGHVSVKQTCDKGETLKDVSGTNGSEIISMMRINGCEENGVKDVASINAKNRIDSNQPVELIPGIGAFKHLVIFKNMFLGYF